jgi:C1A family cysteine protease
MTDEFHTRTIQGYGWKPSLPDHRDILADASELPVMKEVDPRSDYMTEIYNQLRLGSCTANTVAEAVDAYYLAQGKEAVYPSRLGIYGLERLYEGSPLDQDTGAYGRDGYRAVRRFGMIPERDFPYSDNIAEWQKDPRPIIERSSDRVKLDAPYKVVPRHLTTFKRVLSNRQTIGFGFTVFESFESDEVARTGIVPMPDPSEKDVGGHEVLLVGYLADMPAYGLVRNHWDKDWGIGGYFLMPWTYILDPQLADDFRTIYVPKH